MSSWSEMAGGPMSRSGVGCTGSTTRNVSAATLEAGETSIVSIG